MLVRTYGRRTRGGAAAGEDDGGERDVYVIDSDSGDDESDLSCSPLHHPSFSQPQSSSQENPNPSFLTYLSAFSSQDSSSWSLDPDSVPSSSNMDRVETASLMEAQEFGEMMEYRDEVDFAIDGLRPGKPVRIRRASLLSLLNVCLTPHQRQLLRAHGLAKRIIDALVSLNVDDEPCSAAAAAIFYVLASDAQDDQLLNSPSCIRFLLKLLNPPKSNVEMRAPSVGAKLLGLSRIKAITVPNKVDDSSSKELMEKVEEVLLSCKEITRVDGFCGKRPELSPKWIALLTMEKACFSTVSLEEMSDKMRKRGGSFKERLREFSGFNAIFGVLVSCQSELEAYMKSNNPPASALKDSTVLQSIMLLLKCFKTMENATFLSKDNQDHLLKMGRRLSAEASQRSFIGVVFSVIKHLSDLSLAQSCCALDREELKSSDVDVKENCRGSSSASSSTMNQTEGNDSTTAINVSVSTKRRKMSPSRSDASISGCPSSLSCNSLSGRSIGDRFKKSSVVKVQMNKSGAKSDLSTISERLSSIKSLGVGKNHGDLHKRPRQSGSIKKSSSIESFDQFEFNEDITENSGVSLQKRPKQTCKKLKVSQSAKSNLIMNSFDEFEFDEGNQNVSRNDLLIIPKELSKNRPLVSEHADRDSSIDESDPFEFDGDIMEPSKWEKPNLKSEPLQRCGKKMTRKGDMDDQLDLAIVTRDGKPSQPINTESQSLSQPLTQEEPAFLEDCLLASVKVLINLTNDNPMGCQQIATYGGLDLMASMIIKHFPMFDNSNPNDQTKDNKRLRDHELDLLVAILGLLVNLVEKDSRNRLRLASPCVSIDQTANSEKERGQRDLIPLFCGIFLANQGAGDVAEEKEIIAPDDAEAYLLQGEKEAEKMIVEAYSALLLAFLSTESMEVREAIASCLPNNNLLALVPVLERFVAFHLSLNMISPETHSAVTKVIESCKGP